MGRIVVIMVVFLSTASLAGDAGALVANPEYAFWSQYEAGSWVKRKFTTTKPGGSTEVMEMTATVVQVMPEKVVLEWATRTTVNDEPLTQRTRREDIPAKVAEDSLEAQLAAEPPHPPDAKLGEEHLTIAGRTFLCQTVEMTQKGGDMTFHVKQWTSDELPGGTARSERTATGRFPSRTVEELVAWEVRKSAASVPGRPIENPEYLAWARHEPGSAVTVSITVERGGTRASRQVTTTLVEIAPEKLVLRSVQSMVVLGRRVSTPAEAREVPARVQRLNTTIPVVLAAHPPEDARRGRERVTVAGREFDCQTVETVTTEAGVSRRIKTWTSPEVPGAVVRSQTVDGGSGEMTLVEIVAMQVGRQSQ